LTPIPDESFFTQVRFGLGFFAADMKGGKANEQFGKNSIHSPSRFRYNPAQC
jgi:hypothetical protein